MMLHSSSFYYLETFFIFIFFLIQTADSAIKWKKYTETQLQSGIKEFYTESWDAEIEVPMQRSKQMQTYDIDNDESESLKKNIKIYVRKFSHTEKVTRHLWLISGGPGSSTSGIERALSVKLLDTAIYLMDNRGLGRSHKYQTPNYICIILSLFLCYIRLCSFSDQKYCLKDPKKCYEALEFPSKIISMHETAQDYNDVSRMIREMEGGGDIYMYGSSYGATLAYTAFKFAPNLVKLFQILKLLGFIRFIVFRIITRSLHSRVQTEWRSRCEDSRHRFVL